MTNVLESSNRTSTANSSPRRITFVSTMEHAPWGGSEQLWSDAAIRLAHQRHHITASIRGWPQPDPAVGRLRDAGCTVYEREWRRYLNLAVKGLGRDPARWQADRFFKKAAPDLVVISGAFGDGQQWCEACEAQGIPYTLVAQVVAEMWWPDDVRGRRVDSTCRAARQIFFVSQANLQLVQKMLARRIPNASVIRNPFNVDYNAHCPYPSSEPTYNLACVGRLEPAAKGQDLLFEVLSQEKWRARNVKVSFFGKGVQAEGMQALSRFYGLDSVAFCGHTGNVQEIWKTHHALVLPSRFEGLPLALVEAMLCGRPAVVTQVAGNTEVLDDNETGFVAAAPTATHLDEAMERAWARRADWEKMGSEAARRIRLAVPQDPAMVFAENLIALAESHSKESSYS